MKTEFSQEKYKVLHLESLNKLTEDCLGWRAPGPLKDIKGNKIVIDHKLNTRIQCKVDSKKYKYGCIIGTMVI